MESIWHSSFVRGPERRAVVEVGAAIPVAVPRFTLDGAVVRAAACCASASARIGLAAPFGDRGAKSRQCRVQEPAQPDAFAASLGADPVHAVVPIAAAHQRQAMRADRPGSRSSARTQCSYSGRGARRETGRKVRFVLVRLPAAALEERHLLVQDRGVAGDLDVVGDGEGQPQRDRPRQRVRTPRPVGGCHQCCTSPSTNWRRGGAQRCARGRAGRRRTTSAMTSCS